MKRHLTIKLEGRISLLFHANKKQYDMNKGLFHKIFELSLPLKIIFTATKSLYSRFSPRLLRYLPRQTRDFHDFCRDIAAIFTIFAATMPRLLTFWFVAAPRFLAFKTATNFCPWMEGLTTSDKSPVHGKRGSKHFLALRRPQGNVCHVWQSKLKHGRGRSFWFSQT